MHKSFVFLRMYHKLELSCESTCAKTYHTCTQWHNSIVTPANQSTCAKAFRTCTQWHNSIVTPANQSTCAKAYRTCTQWHNTTVNRPIKAHVPKHKTKASTHWEAVGLLVIVGEGLPDKDLACKFTDVEELQATIYVRVEGIILWDKRISKLSLK